MKQKDNQNIDRIIEFIKSIYLSPDQIAAIPQAEDMVLMHFEDLVNDIIITPPLRPPRLS